MSTYNYQISHESEAKSLLWSAGLLMAGLVLLFLIVIDTGSLITTIPRAVLGFAFITLVPGYLVRLILRINEPSAVQAVLNSAGLSVLYSLIVAIILNFVLRGITQPLRGELFAGVLVFTTTLLVGLLHLRGQLTTGFVFKIPNIGTRFWRAGALLTCLPVLSILGAHLVDKYGYDGLALAFVALIAAVPVLLRTRIIPEKLEAYCILCVAVAVLYHTTIISPHIWGWDIHYEYYSASRIIQQGYWNPAYEGATYSLLTITTLSGLYSGVTGLSLAWVFKLIYPVLFAGLPLGVYELSKRLFDDEFVACLAPFLIIFYYGFFKDMPDKQAIGEVFLVLILLAIVTVSVSSFKCRVLEVSFIAALIISHYSTSFLFVAFFAVSYVIVLGSKKTDLLRRGQGFWFVRPMFVVLFGTLWLFWFMFTSGGLNFERIVIATETALVELFVAGSSGRSGVGYVTESFGSSLWTVYKGIYVVLIACIGIGILRELIALYNRGVIDKRGEIAILAAVVYGFLGSSVVVTFNLGFDRALHISLVVLSPFAIIGLRSIIKQASQQVSIAPGFNRSHATKVFAVFLAVMFLFSSGAVFTVAGDEIPPYSIGLDEEAGWPVYSSSEIAAARWVDQNTRDDAMVGVYSRDLKRNDRDALLLSEFLPEENMDLILPTTATATNSSYMYVSDKPSYVEVGSYETVDPQQTRYYGQVLAGADEVYTSGDALVYHTCSNATCVNSTNRSTRTSSAPGFVPARLR